ncbi:ribonuclease R [Acetivibrio cellulolyticus]|uniref:ribonuclease R n=1 Tax=Acetivibrio cellulolyticus TaxID=35830 RepID=UPI0001E2E798|nr:ribonuclease R [Acetivibrio cellulolyticus]
MADRKERILEFMREDAYKPLLFGELITVLDVPKTDIELFKNVMDELETEGKIFKTHKDRYGVPERMNLIVGRLQGNERGYGFVIPDDEDIKDVFVSADSLNGAMNNDRVIARINKKVIGDKRAEGEIIRIIERANKTVVGTFESSKYFGFVVPDDRRISADIFIPKDEVNGAKSGQKVITEILLWPGKRRNAEGKIIEIIGDRNEPGADILSIIKLHNLVEEFPESVIRQAESIGQTVTEEMSKGRRDLRGLRMVTIDGEDAKDLDDAVSVEKLKNGNYKLGVHIADVSHYVTEDSPLDREALKRGTSVYLVDRVIPMLPKALSNGICSLNPQIDRLSFTVMMEIDSTGKVVDHEIFESVINTNERMTYTNVYKILVEKDKELLERYDYLIDDFKAMEELAMILRNKRMQRGAIDFDFEEAKILLDEKGKPIQIKRYEITIANKIIEEFMLACNETVAEHFFWANVPFVYRVHEDPDTDKIENFSEFVHNLGYTLKGINKIHPKALQDLLQKVKNTREERIISTVMLRSLQKAKYTHLNQGHFGLAAKYYCHFTSPIRRYPDLIIHRIMKEYLKGQMDAKREGELIDSLPEIARMCSQRERVAEEAERDTEDLKKVEYMKQYEGQVFEGIISSVTSFGMFVELDNTIEGLIRMSNMEDDYYTFNDKQYCLIGERTRKVYRIGDVIKVVLARADVAARRIEFTIIQGEDVEDGEIDREVGAIPEEKPKRNRKGKADKDVLLHIQGKKKDKPKKRIEKSGKKKEKSEKKTIKSGKKREKSSRQNKE